MTGDAPLLSVDYALFERLVPEYFTIPAAEFPLGDVLLPESPPSIHWLLAETAGVAEGDDDYDARGLEDAFKDKRAERAAFFGFWSDSVTLYTYRFNDGRCLACWLGAMDIWLDGIALLRNADVYPAFFEELVASCGDSFGVFSWGSLPEDMQINVSPETLLRATFRYLPYADNGEAWDYYAQLGRAGKMPLTFPGPMPSWVREQDAGYWTVAYEYVKEAIGFIHRDA